VNEGLHTRIVVDCTTTKVTALGVWRCPPVALVGPHVTAVIGDFRRAAKTAYGPPIEAYLFDSSRAADAFQIADTFIGLNGTTLRPFIRLQRRNLVVTVTRRGAYKRKTKAALNTLG
jgi:hypothetical protein